jgi:hypothetical protein
MALDPRRYSGVVARKSTEDVLATAKAAGIEITVTQHLKGTGEVVPLPGVKDAEAG